MTEDATEDTWCESRYCKMVAHALGWLAIAWAVSTCYRAYQSAADLERLYPPSTVMNLGLAYLGINLLSMIGVAACLILGALTIVLRHGKWSAWLITFVAIAIALAAKPIGRHATDRVVAKNHYVNGG